jgi:hypothetical protein
MAILGRATNVRSILGSDRDPEAERCGFDQYLTSVLPIRARVNRIQIQQSWIMYDLTGFQRDLLYTIAGLEDPHGLAIKENLEEYYESEIHHGRLYPNLDTLVEKGLVEKGEKDRRTNVYRLTRRGRGEIQDRREWENEYLEEPVEA